MIDILHTLGLTDWSSFCWGAGAMFILVCVTIGLWSWGNANAPTMREYEEDHRV